MGIQKNSFALENGNYSNTYLGTLGPVTGPVLLGKINYKIAGVFSNTQPIEMLPINFNGNKELSFLDLYYNTIWNLPSFLDFQDISTDEVLSSQTWHAYFTPNTVVDINIISPSNVIQNSISIGYIFKPLELKTLNFTALKSGPPSIETLFSFELSNSVFFNIQTAGVRSRDWEFEVNWSGSYESIYEYKTDIIESRNGTLQRRGLRKNARRFITHSTLAINDEVKLLEGFLSKSQNRLFTINDEGMNLIASNNIISGQDTILSDYIPDWVQVGVNCAIDYGNVLEIKEVLSFTSNSITFSSPFLFNHAKKTLIRKRVPAFITTEQRMSKVSPNAITLEFEYSVPPGFEDEWPSGDPYPLFLGRELFLRRPNEREAIPQTINAPREELDYGRGVAEYLYPVEYNFISRDLLFTNFTLKERDELINFFRRRRGRLGSFWVPSWGNDFKILQPIFSSSNTISIEGSLVNEFYSSDKTHRCIYVETITGEIYVAKIASMTLQTGNTSVILETNFTVDIPLNNILSSGWLYFCRFASDSLSVNQITSLYSEINYPLINMEIL